MSEQLDRRKIIWSAFSELWLDTEMQEYTLNSIALKMKQSGYSLQELKYIYQREVAPVVYNNLLNVAGVWDGFDETWLYEEIQQNIKNKNSWSTLCFYLKKPMMFYTTKQDWATLEALFLDNSNNDKIN